MARSKVLVVDDSPIQRELIEGFIRAAGHEVVVAEDGFEGIAAAFRARPDVIVSDVIMPEVGGYHLCRFVKSDARLAHIPVLLLTSAGVRKLDRFWGMRSGADAYIDKERDPTKLLAALEELVAKARLRRKNDGGAKPASAPATSQEIKSSLNLLFDRLLFESTVANEIRELGRFVWAGERLAAEFCKLVDGIVDYAAMGVVVLHAERPRVFVALNEPVDHPALLALVTALAEAAGTPDLPQRLVCPLGADLRVEGYELSISPERFYQPQQPGAVDRQVVFCAALSFRDEQLGAVCLLGQQGGGFADEARQSLELALRELAPIVRTAAYYEESQRLLAATARQELAAQWRKAKVEWEQTFDAISEAITVHDLDCSIVRANDAARSLLGIGREADAPQKCHCFFHRAGRPLEGCPAHRTAVSGEAMTLERYEPHLDRHLRIRTFPRRGDGGELIGVVHVATDISAEVAAKKREAELQHQLLVSKKLDSIGSLAGGIAHDFNNVLTVVLGNSEAALSLLDKDDPNVPFFSEIMEAGEQGARLIRQLLAFARKQSMQRRPLQLGAVVEGMSKLLGRLIGEDVQLAIHVEANLPCISADEGQIEQVLLNLIVNARDAMPQGGRIDVALRRVEAANAGGSTSAWVELAITDTGCGMAEEVRERIFEPFFTTKPMARGTGLGLSTVHGIVTQHNGEVSVESAPGAGSTFRLRFPASADGPATEAMAASRELPCGEETIWLVDDDPGVRRFMELALTRLGYDVLAAASGPELLTTTEGLPAPDLLVTDVVMPRMNGVELVEAVRTRYPELRVLLVSGYSKDVLDRHGLDDESCRLLAKPLTAWRLADGVRRTLDGRPITGDYDRV